VSFYQDVEQRLVKDIVSPGRLLGGHTLDPLSAPVRCLKWVREILCLPVHLGVPEFHDADCVHRLDAVGNHILGDPQVARTEHTPNREVARSTGVMGAQRLQVTPAEDPLARLRVFAYHIIVVDLVLRFLIAGSGSSPVSVQ